VFISLSLPAKFVLSERESCLTPVATYPFRVRVSVPQFFDFLEPSKLRIKPRSKFFENCWVRESNLPVKHSYTHQPLTHWFVCQKRENRPTLVPTRSHHPTFSKTSTVAGTFARDKIVRLEHFLIDINILPQAFIFPSFTLRRQASGRERGGERGRERSESEAWSRSSKPKELLPQFRRLPWPWKIP
jgi:hypothetical protein